MSFLAIGINPAIDRILECPDFHIGGHQQARQIARLASGKSANVSRALAQLGHDSIATGFVGADELEFFHEQLLSTSGNGRILCHFVEVTGKTRENITILDPIHHVETHIRDRGFTVSPAEIDLLDKRISHDLKPGDFAIFSGSLCQGLPEDYFAGLIDRCTNLQAKVVIDSNGQPLRVAAQKRLFMLKPNLEELRQLTGTDVPNATTAIRDAALPFLNHIDFLLISRGSQGAVLLTADGSYSARSLLKTAPIRTVGCGDHLLAGFIAEIAAGRDPERALRAAVAVATARALSPRMDEFDPELVLVATENIAIEKI